MTGQNHSVVEWGLGLRSPEFKSNTLVTIIYSFSIPIFQVDFHYSEPFKEITFKIMLNAKNVNPGTFDYTHFHLAFKTEEYFSIKAILLDALVFSKKMYAN